MTADFLKRMLLVSPLLVVPAAGYAHEATLTGAVTDSTGAGAVLPRATVTAVHEASGIIRTTVLPYSNQQMSGTHGGPIVRDGIHFFGSSGYEREPQTCACNSPYPSFNVDQVFTDRAHEAWQAYQERRQP